MSRIGIVLIISLLAAGFIGREVHLRWNTALVIPAGGYQLGVLPGETLNSVAAKLHQEGVLPYPALLRFYGRFSGLDRKIKAGEYLLPQYLDSEALLLLLSKGNVIRYRLTLPEGITLRQALALMGEDERLLSVLDGVDDPRILKLIAPLTQPEGLFFPDSYHFERGDSDWDILQRAYHRMQSVLTQEWLGRAEELPYQRKYDALIMASIVERETGQPSERAEIAGVFVRRLQKHMRLQTDPTVIYGMGEDFNGNIRRADLKNESNPYNTYRHKGLPPSPIALPGREAIHGALHPASGDALYFVAKGDGAHVFSATLEAHQKAVRKYQMRRRANYRSSPEKK